MPVVTGTVKLETTREGEMMDITRKMQDAVSESGLKDGIAVVFVAGSTGAVTTIEYEPGLLADFPDMLQRIAPKEIQYEHERRWHDGNGHSHVRASMIGPSLTVPFNDSHLTLGTWQQVVFLELDVRPRSRQLIVQMVGE